MKVLLTGALGNIGEFALHALLQEGHEVVAFELDTRNSRKIAARLDPRVRMVWGNITSAMSVRSALKGIDAVVHLAGIVPPTVDKCPELARQVNVDGTRILIEEMERSNTARRLIFSSSVGVFGDIQNREPPLRVDTPVSPTDEYGRQKVTCETAIRESSLDWTIMRLGAAVPVRLLGSHYDPRAGFEISADARVEFIHPADAGLAFARAAGCELAIGKVLYIGGGAKCQMIARDFYNDLMDHIGIGPIPDEACAQAEYPRFTGDWLDTGESQKLLQYQTRTLDDIKVDLGKGLGPLVLLIRLLRPLATWYYVNSSPYLKENRARKIRK